MKRFIAFLSFIILVVSFGLTAFSMEINGIDDGAEWDDSTIIKLIDGESNCKVNFGLLKSKINNETNTLYLCFMFTDPDLMVDNNNIGLSLIIGDSDQFVITVNSTPTIYDIDKYSFDAALSIDENHGATCEIMLGLKYGLPDIINGSVRFIDSEGSPSNFYYFSVENNLYSITSTETYKNDNFTENSPQKSTTTKISTTKSKTTKTTKAEKYTFPDLGFLIADNTTTTTNKKSNTKTTTKKPSTTKSKTTKSSKKEKTTAKIIEKESLISVVTQPILDDLSTTDITTLYFENTDYTLKSSLSSSDGSKYKTMTAIFGGIALITVAALGTLGSKRKDNDNDPKS